MRRSWPKPSRNLRPGLAGGLLVPDDSTVYAPCAASWLLEQSGAALVRQRVVGISGRGLRLANGEFVDAGIAIHATGTWAPELAPGLAVRKRKGHLAITDRYPGLVRHALVELGYLKSAHSTTADSVAFNVQPRRSGQVLLGLVAPVRQRKVRSKRRCSGGCCGGVRNTCRGWPG